MLQGRQQEKMKTVKRHSKCRTVSIQMGTKQSSIFPIPRWEQIKAFGRERDRAPTTHYVVKDGKPFYHPPPSSNLSKTFPSSKKRRRKFLGTLERASLKEDKKTTQRRQRKFVRLSVERDNTQSEKPWDPGKAPCTDNWKLGGHKHGLFLVYST